MRFLISLVLYRLLFILLLPVILLTLVIRSINHKAYRQRLNERLGLISANFQTEGILVHAASVGEILALKSYINQLIEQFPDCPITITTFTPTGSAQVKSLFGDQVQHCYFPLDVWPCTSLFLNTLRPKAVVLMETEIWPNFIAQCKQRGITLQLINGRLSDNSMKSYKKLAWLITPSIQAFDQILAQSHDNQANFLRLGAKQALCDVSGNLKFDITLNAEVLEKAAKLKTYIQNDRPIWLIASTHPGDEALALSVLKQLKEAINDILLVIVPRHPERFEQVAQLCQQAGYSVIKRSEHRTVSESNDIWLIDTLGELLPCCDLADVVTMGGSFSDIGGHNPLEPALFSKAIVVGHDMRNFRRITQQMLEQHALIQLCAPASDEETTSVENLTDTVGQLLTDKDKCQQLGLQAKQVVTSNQGASRYSVDALASLLNG